MRSASLVLFAVLLSAGVTGAQEPPVRVVGPQSEVISAELFVKRAAERLAGEKKTFERDLAVLRHLRAADAAIADAMQPAAAIQKAIEHVSAAAALVPPSQMPLSEGVMRMQRELESARRSPANADFGRLRSLLRQEAVAPAVRILRRSAVRLQQETIAWLGVQESISELVRGLTAIVGESLRETE